MFKTKIHVLAFRGHIFSKLVGRFRWFEKCENTIHIPSINCFKLYKTFINPLNASVNPSIDLLWKSIDWFLYEGNTGI